MAFNTTRDMRTDPIHVYITEEKLKNLKGVELVDIRVYHNPEKIDVSFVGSPITDTVIDSTQLESKYTVIINQDTADFFINTSEIVRNADEERRYMSQQLEKLNLSHKKLQSKLKRFAGAIAETGSEKHWDELLTMLKLAGFDEDILSNDR